MTVLTGIPNYPKENFIQVIIIKKNRKETWNGIDIIRIPIIQEEKLNLDFLNYISFVYSDSGGK